MTDDPDREVRAAFAEWWEDDKPANERAIAWAAYRAALPAARRPDAGRDEDKEAGK